ncbi:amidase family protein [Bacillus sp. 1P06AnD]|uniref:amidase family protein n=1 Tax=Bacillus sp. 1P06AnD TaxID=3132208 RepID=UPI0039A14632
MRRIYKVLGALVLLLLLLAIGGYIYIKSVAPPGEERIAYGNGKLIASIDKQIKGLDMEKLRKDKEKYVIEKNIEDLQKAVKDGLLTYEEITAIYLHRIQMLDQNKKGFNSVVEINPKAIQEAREMDRRRTSLSGNVNSPLFGLPVMLKDNINTSDMPTSAGAVAFADFMPKDDAPLVKELKAQGAIILGKNNLSKFAYFVSSIMPSGYSGKKGQTLNPFGPLKISPSGSSSGSAVAVTANLIPIYRHRDRWLYRRSICSQFGRRIKTIPRNGPR